MGTNLSMELLLPLLGRAGRVADLVAEWLLTYALHSTVLILAAWALVTVMRGRWSPAAQSGIWRAALVAGWVTATVQLAAPWRPLSGPLNVPRSGSTALTALRVEASRGAEKPVTSRTLVFRPAASGAFATPGGLGEMLGPVRGTEVKRVMVVALSFASLAVAGWALVAALAAAQLAWLRRRLHLALAGRHDARESLAGHALRHLQRQAGLSRPVALSFSETLQVPAALPGDEIILPLRAVHELTLAEQEGVLAHELAHVVRRDTFWLQLASWMERLAWFQPLNRLARRQMQASAEFAADAWAARLTGQPLRLAQALARVAAWRRAAGPGPAAAAYASAMAADGSPLVDRVRRLTAPGGPSASPLGGLAAWGAMGAVALAALLVLPSVEFARSAGPSASAEERVELHLTERTGARNVVAWRGTATATFRTAEAGGPTPRARRALILVRRGAGTTS